MQEKQLTILIADDDTDDCLMIQRALADARVVNPINFVHDGAALLDYLHGRPPYDDSATSPRPSLLLLDLNMPKIDGREALAVIKRDPSLRRIPVVVLTTSKAEEDISSTYNLGVNSFITKPVTFDSLVAKMRAIGEYWFETVELPRS